MASPPSSLHLSRSNAIKLMDRIDNSGLLEHADTFAWTVYPDGDMYRVGVLDEGEMHSFSAFDDFVEWAKEQQLRFEYVDLAEGPVE